MIKYICACALLVLVVGCGSSNPSNSPVGFEHAPPTTVVMQLIRVDTAGKALDTTMCTVRDTAVLHGKPRVEGGLFFLSSNTYVGSLKLLDESQTPAKDVTSEIVAEKDAHTFRYTIKGDAPNSMTISNLDKDSKGLDFGLNFSLVTYSGKVVKITGAIGVILEHHDDGNKAGATFDTDINQEFPFEMR